MSRKPFSHLPAPPEAIALRSTGLVRLIIARFSRSEWCLLALIPFTFGNMTRRLTDLSAAPSLVMMAMAGAMVVVALWAPRRPARRDIWIAAVLGVLLGWLRLLSLTAMLMMLVPALVCLVARPRILAWFAGLLTLTWPVAWLVSGWGWGRADIDVFGEVQGAASSLLHGQNPYVPIYPVEIPSDAGFVTVVPGHFGYGPSIFLTALPGRLLGDVRLVSALILLVVALMAVVLVRRHHGGEVAQRATFLLIAGSPLSLLVVLNSSTDLYSLGFLVVWLLVHERGSRRGGRLALGLGFAGKYPVMTVLVAAFLRSPRLRREILAGAAVGLVIVLPFALWTGVGAWIFAVLGSSADQHFNPDRIDALTVNALLITNHLPVLPGWVGISVVLGLGVALIGPWHRMRDDADMLLTGAAVSTLGLLFLKQAFLNYFFPIFVIIVVVAGWPERRPSPAIIETPAPSRPLVARVAS